MAKRNERFMFFFSFFVSLLLLFSIELSEVMVRMYNASRDGSHKFTFRWQ